MLLPPKNYILLLEETVPPLKMQGFNIANGKMNEIKDIAAETIQNEIQRKIEFFKKCKEHQ